MSSIVTNPQMGLGQSGRVDFLIVLIGVIVGLSIGRLVNFVGEFLVHRKHARADLTHGLFLFSIFVYQVFYWWDMWELKVLLKSSEISFLIFLRMLLIPLCLYCATALLCPQLRYPEDGEKISIGNHFFEHCRPFFLIWFALCLIATSQAAAIRAEDWSTPAIYLRLAGAGLFLIGFIFRKRFLNLVLAFLLFAMLVTYIWISLSKIPG